MKHDAPVLMAQTFEIGRRPYLWYIIRFWTKRRKYE